MISITDTDIEDVLKTFLQKQVTFNINGKCWKTGKVLLFKQVGFYIEFTMDNDTKNKIEKFEIPVPFSVRKIDNTAILSYKIKELVCNNEKIFSNMYRFSKNSKSKFFDSDLIVELQ